MLIRRPDDVLPSEITPETVYAGRRQFLKAGLAAPALALAGCGASGPVDAGAPKPAAATDTPDGFRTGEAQTRWEDVTGYNNFYEFGTGKGDPARNAGQMRTHPWTVEVTGAADVTGRFALDDLLRGVAPEDRIYRHRCVEGWSMVVPWHGVPLATVMKRFRPTSRAKYVAFTTLLDTTQMPDTLYNVLNWPYKEGLRIDEAMHPLTLLATGLYGKPLPNQNGAPLRLVVPWKYGFKSIKSIVRIAFVDAMPETSWNNAAPDEYGFFSNVNPAVDHPRWSQASERRISGSGSRLFADRIPTRPFNGYASQVAGMYAGMDLRRWF